MSMENFVYNAEKSFTLFKGMFQKAPPSTPNQKKELSANPSNKNNNMIIKSSSSNNQLIFDLDDDDYHCSPSASPKSKAYKIDYKEPEDDIWQIAHRVYPKRSMIDISSIDYVSYVKVKRVENVATFLGIINTKEKFKKIQYLAFFDEFFLYMINMSKKENNKYNTVKKIGNHYDIRKISTIDVTDDIEKGKKCITLTFINKSTQKEKNKILHFDYENAVKFFNMLKYYLRKNKVPLYYEDLDIESDMNGALLSNCSISTSSL